MIWWIISLIVFKIYSNSNDKGCGCKIKLNWIVQSERFLMLTIDANAVVKLKRWKWLAQSERPLMLHTIIWWNIFTILFWKIYGVCDDKRRDSPSKTIFARSTAKVACSICKYARPLMLRIRIWWNITIFFFFFFFFFFEKKKNTIKAKIYYKSDDMQRDCRCKVKLPDRRSIWVVQSEIPLMLRIAIWWNISLNCWKWAPSGNFHQLIIKDYFLITAVHTQGMRSEERKAIKLSATEYLADPLRLLISNVKETF